MKRFAKVKKNIVEDVEIPRLVQLGNNLFAVVFNLMKLLAAHFILERAKDDGYLTPQTMVVETTSGTFGLALAILRALMGYRLTLVGDPAISPALKQRMEELGTQVEIVTKPSPVGGFQKARLDKLAAIQEKHPENFCPSQYSNPHNQEAYAPVAELICEAIGPVDCLVGPVGSGGSMSGTSDYLRWLFPELYTIGVDTHNSVIFGHQDGKRLLRGLGNSLMPKNVEHTAFNEVHWVSAAEAFATTRRLHKEHALYMGPTSGAAYLAARWYAERHPDAKVVVFFPDEGYRYQDTVYNDNWLRANNVMLSQLPVKPCEVTHPTKAGNHWSSFSWNRRTYEQVMGKHFKTAS